MAETKIEKEKLIVIFLILLGVGTLWLGFSSLGSRINSSDGKVKSLQNQENNNTIANDTLNNILELKNKDTDNDGLSDYDEINVYQTSIYLSDTDGDGFNDKEEIDSYNDPNCPVGGDCSIKADIIKEDTSIIESNLLSGYGADNVIADPNNASNQVAEKVFSGQLSVTEVRELLIASGMNKSDLDQISDADIMQTYNELLANTGN